MSFKTICGVLSAIGALATSQTSLALDQKPVEQFDFYWNFDNGGPNSLDLYNNNGGTACNGGQKSEPSLGCDNQLDFQFAGAYSLFDGIITLPNGGYMMSNNTSSNDAIWGRFTTSLSPNDSYTLEFRVRAGLTSGKGVAVYDLTDDSNSVGGLSILNDGNEQSIHYGIDPSANESFRLSKPADAFFDVRIIARRSGADYVYSLFIDGQRAGTDLTKTRALSNLNRVILGDIGSQHFGQMQVDHLGFTAGEHYPSNIYPGAGVAYLFSSTGSSVLKNMESHEITALPHTPTLISYRGGTGCGDGFRFQTSVDGGANWSSLGCIDPGVTKFDNPVLRHTGPNRYLLVYRDRKPLDDLIAQQPPGSVCHDGLMPCSVSSPSHEPEFLPSRDFDVWSVRSTDGGQTWGDHRKILNGYNGSIIDFTTAVNGDIIVPLSDAFDASSSTERIRTRIFRSTDGGANWTEAVNTLDIGLTGVFANGTEDGSFEPTITQRPDGVLEILMRTTQGRFWQSQSYNSGIQWKDLKAETRISTSSTYGFLLSMSDGRMALLYAGKEAQFDSDDSSCIRTDRRNHAAPTSICRQEIFLSLSSNNGTSWSAPRLVAAQAGPAGHRLNFRMFEYSPGTLWMRIGDDWFSVTP